MTISYQRIREKAGVISKWMTVALGTSIPISTALDSILIVLILILWIVAADYKAKLIIIRENRVALVAIAMFGSYAIGMLYGAAEKHDAIEALKNSVIFLLIPFLIPLLHNTKMQHYGLYGFLFAMIITLILSYLIWLNMLPNTGLIKGASDNPMVFKFQITHNLLMAFSAFLFTVQAWRVKRRGLRITFTILSGFAIYNVLFMVQGRTGYLVLLALASYLLFSKLRWKGLLVSVGAVIVLGGVVYGLPSSTLSQRVRVVVDEYSSWNPEQASATSVGRRLEFYKNSLEIVREHPVLGVGTGGFPTAYAKHVKNSDMTPTHNPHNEYLMVAVQLGLVGLILMLYLFYTQWRLAKNLPGLYDKIVARGMLLTIMSASLVSSTLIDHTEGLFYAWMSALLYAKVTSSEFENESGRT